MFNNLISKNRIDWVDMSKGIAILLVIIGHTVWGLPRGAIFSFHMPLFFILSAVTYKPSHNREEFATHTRRAFKHLIIPLLIVFAIDFVIDVYEQFSALTDISAIMLFLKDTLLSYLFCSCVPVYKFGLAINAIGIPYFFMVLFLSRTIYDFLQYKFAIKYQVIAIVLLAAFGVFISPVAWLPFSLDIAFAVLPFVFVGHHLQVFELQHKTFLKMIISLGVWAVILVVSHVLGFSYLEIAIRNYPFFPVFYIIAVAGTVTVCCFSIMVCRFNGLTFPIRYIGKNSLYMFVIHHFDSVLVEPYIKPIVANDYIHAALRVVVDLVLFCVVMVVVEVWKRRERR